MDTYHSQALQEIPSVISAEDREKLAGTHELELPAQVVLYEELMDRYPVDSHPYFLVRKADLLDSIGGGAIAIDLYRKAQTILAGEGVNDAQLDVKLQQLFGKVDIQANRVLEASRQSTYYRDWMPTKQYIFPTNLPQLPPGAQLLKERWQELTKEGSNFYAKYLIRLAVDTNHVENTFLIHEESAQDCVRRGISEANITCLPQSALSDPEKIRSILLDTVAAYHQLMPLVSNTGIFDKPTVCSIHETLMKTCRFVEGRFVAAGNTRSETRKTVLVTGSFNVQMCPFPYVDEELEYICRMAKQWMRTWRNPFASASWTHLALVSCHPFDDGNSRLARILASIPLMQHGFPPLSVTFNQCADYFGGIRMARDGDHTSVIECFMQGMEDTIASVQSM